MTGNPRVLVVEDEAPIRKLLRLTLSHHQFDCVESERGEDGLLRAAEYNPEVVILDLGLPDIDGLDWIRRFREWSKAPVIVLTARDLSAADHERLNGSVTRILQKGAYSREALLAEVRALVAASVRQESGA
jgi:DNA-binding response OmpR family regulator